MTPATLIATWSCSSKTSSSDPSNRSAQRWEPVPASINWAVMRTRPAALRTEPSSMYRTPNSRPIRLTSTACPLYVKLELAATTKSERMRASAVMISSTMPSVKYSCSGSPLRLWNGNTASDGLSGKASSVSVDASGTGSERAVIWRRSGSPRGVGPTSTCAAAAMTPLSSFVTAGPANR
jgi:hypothetical protein